MERRQRRAATLVTLIAATLVLPGCGTLVDAALDQATEQVADEATAQADEFGVSAEDGAITIQGDQGSITLRGPADEPESATLDTGGGPPPTAAPDFFPDGFTPAPAELPEGLTIPVPDGGTIERGISLPEPGLVRLDAVVRYPASEWDRIVAFYGDFADGTGLTRAELDVDPGPVLVYLQESANTFIGVTIAPQGPDVVVHIEDAVTTGPSS